jgi:hypothetical protein
LISAGRNRIKLANHFLILLSSSLGASIVVADGHTATASSNDFLSVCVQLSFRPKEGCPVSFIRISCGPPALAIAELEL